MKRIADLLVTYRLWVALAVGAVTVLALAGVARLEIDDVPTSIFRSDDEAFARLEEVFRDFGSDDNDCLVVLEAEDFFAPETAAVLRALGERIQAVDGVEATFSLADVVVFNGAAAPRSLLPTGEATAEAFEEARRRAAEHPLVADRILSPDGRTALLVARLAGSSLAIGTMAPIVGELRTVVAETTAGTTVRGRLTGVPPLRIVIFEEIGREQRLFPPLGALAGFVVAFAVFRRLAPVLIATSASVLAALWALGGMGLVGEPLNLLNVELPLLIMVIALTDAVHLMIDILRARRAGTPALEASRDAIRRLGVPCALTSLTTAVGFASLSLSRIELIQSFGLLFAGAVALTFVAVLCTVPLLSSVISKSVEGAGVSVRREELRGPAEAFVRGIVRHARVVAILGAALTLGLLLVSLRLVPDNRLTESTPRGNEATAALRHCENVFGGVLAAGVLVEWPARLEFPAPEITAVVGEVRDKLRDHPFTGGTLSFLELAELLPGEGAPERRLGLLPLLPDALLRGTLRADLRRALVSARVPDAGSGVADPAFEEIQRSIDVIRARHPDFTINLTGTGYIARRNVNFMIGDFALGLAIAAAVIFGVLTLAFRSLRLGLVSVLPNAFPLVVSSATLVFLGLELQIVSVIAFTVCLGIAVDDTIHFLARYRRELAATGDVEEAIVRAFVGVGRALLVTTATLLAGFGVLFLSEIPTSRLFAGIGCIGLVSALLGDLIFLPALLALRRRPPADSPRTTSRP